jgi:hypothetical protein
MAPDRDVLLLLALPASGKSEIRRYLDHAARGDLGIGKPVHLDDYPYVHLMRRADAELDRLGAPPLFFASETGTFIDPRDWSTLTLLIDEDARTVLGQAAVPGGSPRALFERIDTARAAGGAAPGFATLSPGPAEHLERELAGEASRIAVAVAAASAAWRPGTATLVVEFARGGPSGAQCPLDPPHGYRHALSMLSPAVLERAAVLYVWVTPEDSRRRNAERARPGPQGDASILYHGVPERVMVEDYGCDDMEWLLETAPAPDSIRVPAQDGSTLLPAVRLDNRDDLTSHLRAEPPEWDPAAADALHRRLRDALAILHLTR